MAAHLLEFLGRRLEQCLSLVRAQLRELRVAARDQALARIVRVRELEEIALVEEPELQRAALDAACGSAPLLSAVIQSTPVERREGRRSAVCEIIPRSPTSTSVAMPKLSRSCCTCGSERLAVGRVALEDRDRHRDSRADR